MGEAIAFVFGVFVGAALVAAFGWFVARNSLARLAKAEQVLRWANGKLDEALAHNDAALRLNAATLDRMRRYP